MLLYPIVRQGHLSLQMIKKREKQYFKIVFEMKMECQMRNVSKMYGILCK